MSEISSGSWFLVPDVSVISFGSWFLVPGVSEISFASWFLVSACVSDREQCGGQGRAGQGA